MLHRLRETARVDTTKSHPIAAFYCVPAIALPLCIGILTSHVRESVMAAAGAVSVGFGSFQQLNNSRAAPMIYAAVGMCLSSWIGTVAGLSLTAAIIASAAWAFLYVAVSALGPGVSWIGLQCVVWLVISTAYPASGWDALVRGSFVLLGGLAQAGIIQLSWAIAGVKSPNMGTGNPLGSCSATGVSDVLHPRSCLFVFAVRASLTLAAAALLYRWWHIPNGYWIPMTAAIVLRPDLHQTLARGLARILGTLVGAALATLVVALSRPGPVALALLIITSAWLCYTLLWANYAAFAICLTAYVVFLLSLAGLPEMFVVAHRSLNTVLGGALAVITHWLFFTWEQRRMLLQPRSSPG